MIIDQPEKAQRLARAIAADIQLYNEAKLKAATKAEARAAVAPEIAEGRALYEARVAPSLHSLYEAALEEVIFSRLGEAPGSAGAPKFEPRIEPASTSKIEAKSEAGGDAGSTAIISLVAAILVSLVALLFWSLS